MHFLRAAGENGSSSSTPTSTKLCKSRCPVIFLHGLASNRSRWNEFIRETSLGETRDLIAVDLRGHGDAMTRRAYSLATWSQDIAALLDHKASERGSTSSPRKVSTNSPLAATTSSPRAVLIGHSLGAQAALHFALTHPGRVAGLVLIDPIFRDAVVPAKRNYVRFGPLFQLGASVIRLLNRIGIHRGDLPKLDLEALDQEARIALQDPSQLEAFIAKYSSTKEDLKFIPHANYLQDMVEMFRPLPALTAIACPTLILRSAVAGYQDEVIVSEKIAELSQVKVQMIDCHHWPLTERPGEVRQMIEDWFAATIHE